jgi:uncharacterized protein YlxW (UPF0749 family)
LKIENVDLLKENKALNEKVNTLHQEKEKLQERIIELQDQMI